MEKIVVITGATSGIGEACAIKYAGAGYNLVVTGRRDDRLHKLSAQLEQQFNVKVLPLVFDVQKKDDVEKYLGHLPAEWQQVDILINNAGLALGRDLFEEADMDDWETMLNTNVYGLLYVSRAVLPYMIRQGKGHIVNMGSVAGKEVYERGNAYCASKYAVDAIGKAMRIDLLRHNIRVTNINPGAVETEFSQVRFKGDKEKAAATYTGLKPLTGADIADTVFYCTQLPPHVCINDLVITCTQQAGTYYFYKQ